MQESGLSHTLSSAHSFTFPNPSNIGRKIAGLASERMAVPVDLCRM
jgi:hypothetical protein